MNSQYPDCLACRIISHSPFIFWPFKNPFYIGTPSSNCPHHGPYSPNFYSYLHFGLLNWHAPNVFGFVNSHQQTAPLASPTWASLMYPSSASWQHPLQAGSYYMPPNVWSSLPSDYLYPIHQFSVNGCLRTTLNSNSTGPASSSHDSSPHVVQVYNMGRVNYNHVTDSSNGNSFVNQADGSLNVRHGSSFNFRSS